MKLAQAIELVTEAEEDLAKKLGRLAGRHATEHDVYHLGHQLAVLGPHRQGPGEAGRPQDDRLVADGVGDRGRHRGVRELLHRPAHLVGADPGLGLLGTRGRFHAPGLSSTACWGAG